MTAKTRLAVTIAIILQLNSRIRQTPVGPGSVFPVFEFRRQNASYRITEIFHIRKIADPS